MGLQTSRCRLASGLAQALLVLAFGTVATRAADSLSINPNLRDGQIFLEGIRAGQVVLSSSLDLRKWTPLYAFMKMGPRETLPISVAGRERFFTVTFTDHSIPAGFVWIPPGEFIMGSPDEEVGRSSDEGPQRRVQIRRGFWMSQFETTAQDYHQITREDPSLLATNPLCPVENISWVEATEYCRLRTLRDKALGLIPPACAYRLPSEAEWEYACRAGTTSRFSFGNDPYDTEALQYGWRWANSKATTHPVGQKLPNPWGLYDMHGNVFEWCIDNYGPYPQGQTSSSGAFHVYRGGAWVCSPSVLRSACRHPNGEERARYVGFRVVLGAETDTALR